MVSVQSLDLGLKLLLIKNRREPESDQLFKWQNVGLLHSKHMSLTSGRFHLSCSPSGSDDSHDDSDEDAWVCDENQSELAKNSRQRGSLEVLSKWAWMFSWKNSREASASSIIGSEDCFARPGYRSTSKTSVQNSQVHESLCSAFERFWVAHHF